MAVMTVTGPVAAAQLGITLSHEHLLIDLTNQSLPGSAGKATAITRIERDDLPRLRRDPYLMVDNLCLDNIEDAIIEVNRFRENGGSTIVDCTLSGIGRHPEKLRRIATATGIKIVMGCGYYTYDTHPAALRDWPVEKIRDEMLTDLLDGVGNSKIRAGIIGEIGTSKNIYPDEFKVLRAAAMASEKTRAAIQVHIYPWSKNGTIAADFLLHEKVNPERIVICHSDVAPDKDYIRQLLQRGVRVQFDNFGKEFEPDVSADSFAGGIFAKDVDRVALVAELIDGGFAPQLLITTDICLKCLLKKNGGPGYTHILENIAVQLQARGVSGETIWKTLLVENPASLLDK